LLEELGCDVPLAVTSPMGNHVDGVEYRSLRRADGTILAYVNNLRRQNRRLRLTCNPPVESVWNLSLEREASEDLSLPALECFLLEIATE
ncbi:MAG: hypothetical protein KAX80_05985, partial [Planctomycetes bacterium]|nr:hypothetical protein [Planctomycetota bacterium]